MRSNNKKQLPVALYGMDGRSHKTMTLYLQGPCKGKAVVVDELNAKVDIIDADSIHAKQILEDRQSKTPDRPIILLSLEQLRIKGTIYVKKPVETIELVNALEIADALIQEKIAKKLKLAEKAKPVTEVEEKKIETPVVDKKQAGKKHIDHEERKKTSKHRTAKNLTESGFTSFIGYVEGIDFTDKEQVLQASYNPLGYFLGYVQSAFKMAKEKACILQLNSGWKPLIIFPHSHEIWLDADDKQLRVFARLAIKNNFGKRMSLTPVDKNHVQFSKKMENFYDMEAFMWKLAIWTSKGRYPDSIDINSPVCLKRWPNFTRLVITPHALRITALLISEPRTLINIADSLKIKPQYVFAFISAAHALNLIEQAKREADVLVSPPKIKPSKTKSLLRRILGRLRA